MRFSIRILFALLFILGTLAAQPSPSPSHHRSLLEKKVEVFDVQDLSPAEAIFVLGQQERVSFGLRNLPKRAFLAKTTQHFHGSTVRKILVSLLGDDPAPRLQTPVPGIVFVSFRSPRHTLMDLTIPRFIAHEKAPLCVVNVGLITRIELVLDPSIQGFAGDIPGCGSDDIVGPFHEQNRSVTYLLNLIVGSSRGAFWIARQPDSIPAGDPNRLWQLLEYGLPPAQYLSMLREIGTAYAEQ